MRSSILPTRYSDFDLSFIPHPMTGDITVLKNEEAISRSFKNLVLTGLNERLFYPSKGCGIYQLLFEQMSPIVELSLSDYIKTVVNNWEPRVIIDTVNVYANYEENRYDVTIYYRITNSNDLQKVDFFLELIR